MHELMEICMLVVFYNGNDEIIHKIVELSHSLSRILIVDNGSTNSRILDKLDECKNVTVICNSVNRGIAAALNQGLDFAQKNGYPLLITMDQDSIIDIDSVEKMAKAIDENIGIISVGPFYDGKIHAEDKYVTNLITSGNVLHVEEIMKIGGFNESLFIDCVDIDLSFNIISNGLKMKKIAGAKMTHKIGEYEYSRLFRLKYLSHNPRRYFYKMRNNVFIYKTYWKRVPKLCLKLMCSCIYELLKLVFIERNKIEKLKYTFVGLLQGLGVTVWDNNVTL